MSYSNGKEPPRFCHECRWMLERTLYCSKLHYATNFGQGVPVRGGNPCEHFSESRAAGTEPKPIPRVFMYGRKRDGKWFVRFVVRPSGLVVERLSQDCMDVDKWHIDEDHGVELIHDLIISGDYDVVDK